MEIIKKIICVGTTLIAVSCAPTRVIKPLEKGEKQISANLGGAMIKFAGAPIPLPLTAISYQQGLDTGLTLNTSVHLTSLAFGVIQLEAGLGINAYQSESKKFGVTVSPSINLMNDIWEKNFRIYPQLDALTYWQYGQKPHLVYGGMGSWIELSKVKAHGEVQTNELLPYFMVGHQFNSAKWSFLTELKYLGLQHDNVYLVPDYISPTNKGALGFYFGVGRRFGR